MEKLQCVILWGNTCSKLASLRKKINRHKDSISHINAIKICSRSQEQTIEKRIDFLNMGEVKTTVKARRTAYFLAKKDRLFTDHPDLIELQELNGADFGIGLRSRYSATTMINHIATEMRKTVCDQI